VIVFSVLPHEVGLRTSDFTPLKPQMSCLALLDEVSRAVQCKELEGLGWQRLIYFGVNGHY